MRIGFNFTLTDTLENVQRLIAERRITFCELLIDNFLQVPPSELAAAFDCPVAFHIMHSRFIESDPEFLEGLARRLRAYVDALDPIYVSDHVARFSHDGRQLFHLGEIDYRSEYHQVRDRVARWQDLLGRRVHLENYPSIMEGAWEAPAFFERLTRETGAGVLFDVSNAVCAHRNSGAPLDLWHPVIADCPHFHVAGYSLSISKPEITLDTHDTTLAPDTFGFLEAIATTFDKPEGTITYECDADLEYDSIADDLARLHTIFQQANTDEQRDSRVPCNSPA